MANHSAVLDLPMETLQHITNRVPERNLHSVRLACRSLDAATIDRFAEVNFADFECWIYDAARWAVLQERLSNPRVARGIQRVAFVARMVMPQDRKNVPTAPKAHETLAAAQHSAVAQLTQDMLEFHQNRLPGRNIILPVMRRLAELKKSILVDLFQIRGIPGLDGAVERRLFSAICRAQNKITRLGVDGSSEHRLREALIRHEPGMLTIANGIQAFIYEAGLNDEDIARDPDCCSRLIRFLGRATDVRQFVISMSGLGAGAHPANGLAHSLLLASPFPLLQDLTLDRVWFEASVFLQVLERCRGTLQTLVFNMATTTKRHEHEWESILRYLATIPSLQSLEMHDVCRAEVEEAGEVLNFGRFESVDHVDTACSFVSDRPVAEKIRLLLDQGLGWDELH